MDYKNIFFGHEETIDVVEQLKLLKSKWESDKCEVPEAVEACGAAADALKEIGSQFLLLEQAVTDLLERTIQSLEQIDDTFVETDKKLAESMGTHRG